MAFSNSNACGWSGDKIYIPTYCMRFVRFGGEVDDEAGRASMCIGEVSIDYGADRYSTVPRLSHAE